MGTTDPRDRPPALKPQRVRSGGVHVRRQPSLRDETFDESLFFLLALLAGAISGYLVAVG
jgi:hypothetical protein